MKARLIAAVVWASAVTLPAGCILKESSGGYAAGGPVGGGDDHDGAAPDESDDAPVVSDAVASGDASDDKTQGDGGTADGAALHCSALPFGCVCSPTEPSQASACNIASVIAMPGQQSVCCNNAYDCICVAYECVRVNGSSCSCQLAASNSEGTRVDDCGAVSANPAIKCCRSYGQCVCSNLDCLPIETLVPGCSVKDLLTCDVGNDSVSSCEPAGETSQPRG